MCLLLKCIRIRAWFTARALNTQTKLIHTCMQGLLYECGMNKNNALCIRADIYKYVFFHIHVIQTEFSFHYNLN